MVLLGEVEEYRRRLPLLMLTGAVTCTVAAWQNSIEAGTHE